MHWQLAWQALGTARSVTCTSATLVCVSVVSVVGAERSFSRLAHVVESLAQGGVEYTATVDISRCPWCARTWREAPLLRHAVDEVRITQARLSRVSAHGRAERRVAVHCLPVSRVPYGVQWAASGHIADWSDAMGAPAVVIGARLTAFSDGAELRTNGGVWRVAGHARSRPPLSASAGENDAILVPNRPPFAAMCANGTPLWRLSASDSVGLQVKIARTEDELRTMAAMRPSVRAAWQILRNDRLAGVVRKLVERFAGWVLLVPSAIALLCGAGVFSVQALQSEQRTAEFGVRRAVGASRRDLIGQLLAEAVMTTVAGVMMAYVLLHAAGLLGGAASGVWRSLWLSAAVALPLAVVGLVVPSLAALRASSIAQLEGLGA